MSQIVSVVALILIAAACVFFTVYAVNLSKMDDNAKKKWGLTSLGLFLVAVIALVAADGLQQMQDDENKTNNAMFEGPVDKDTGDIAEITEEDADPNINDDSTLGDNKPGDEIPDTVYILEDNRTFKEGLNDAMSLNSDLIKDFESSYIEKTPQLMSSPDDGLLCYGFPLNNQIAFSCYDEERDSGTWIVGDDNSYRFILDRESSCEPANFDIPQGPVEVLCSEYSDKDSVAKEGEEETTKAGEDSQSSATVEDESAK